MDEAFGRTFSTVVTAGNGGDFLNGKEAAVIGIAAEAGDDHGHFVIGPGETAGGVNGEMSRASAWSDESRGRNGGGERVFCGVEVIDQDFVEPEVGGVGKAVVTAEVD